jgi:hypothetical protein
MTANICLAGLSCLAAWGLSPNAAQAGSYKFHLLQIAGQEQGAATGVTDNDTVVGEFQTASTSEGFVWQKGRLSLVTTSDGSGFDAVNAKGLAAGEYSANGGQGIFTYDIATGKQTLFPAIPSSYFYAFGVGRSGKVVGYNIDDAKRRDRAFAETPTATKYLKTDTFAEGINDSDQIVGFFTSGNAHHGFIFQHNAYTLFDPPGSTATFPRFITNNGTTGGDYYEASGIDYGFPLTAGVTTTYLYPGTMETGIVGFGAGGEVVGNYSTASEVLHGFVYVRGTYYDIDAPKATYTDIYAVNAKGTLVGEAIVNGKDVGFVAICPASEQPCTQ